MKIKVYTIDGEDNGKMFVQSVKVEFSRSKQFGYDAQWNRRVNENVGPVVEFRLGYGKNAPRMAFWCYGCDTTSGMICYAYTEEQTHPEWGEPETPHLLIRLGGRVEMV